MNDTESREKLKAILDATEWEDLDTLWYLIGVCPRCCRLIEHHVDEPFASCHCGTGEDTGEPTFLQQLKHRQSGTYAITQATRTTRNPRREHERILAEKDRMRCIKNTHPSMYELLDVTDGETCYPVGLYITEDGAVEAACIGPPYADCTECDDYVILRVVERKIGPSGWSALGRRVATVIWRRATDGEWTHELDLHDPASGRTDYDSLANKPGSGSCAAPRSQTAGCREDLRTGQYVPTIDSKATRPTSFDLERALRAAEKQIRSSDDGPGVPACCPSCGGSLVGDGCTRVVHCEAADIPFDAEVDGGPLYCNRNVKPETTEE